MCCGASSYGLSFIHDRKLFQELERMVEEDRRVHAESGEISILNEMHQSHADRLKAIIAEHGWPGHALVGHEGNTYAWRIAQHATCDLEFQRWVLMLIKDAVARRDAPMAHEAQLEDLIRITEGRPQLYGTQLEIDADGLMSPLPIEDAAHVNDRRRAAGLGRLEKRVRVVRDEAALVGSGTRNSR